MKGCLLACTWRGSPVEKDPRPLGRAGEGGSVIRSGAEVHSPIGPHRVLHQRSKRKANPHMWLVEASSRLGQEEEGLTLQVGGGEDSCCYSLGRTRAESSCSDRGPPGPGLPSLAGYRIRKSIESVNPRKDWFKQDLFLLGWCFYKPTKRDHF